jgi:hypothetical protein
MKARWEGNKGMSYSAAANFGTWKGWTPALSPTGDCQRTKKKTDPWPFPWLDNLSACRKDALRQSFGMDNPTFVCICHLCDVLCTIFGIDLSFPRPIVTFVTVVPIVAAKTIFFFLDTRGIFKHATGQRQAPRMRRSRSLDDGECRWRRGCGYIGGWWKEVRGCKWMQREVGGEGVGGS